MQAARLLRDMHKLCCHDLPNQIVVAQTLLQLLTEDEADRLSEDGLEYLRRLKASLNVANEMVRVVRELVNLGNYEPRPDQIEWAVLVRDWRAKLDERLAGCAFAVNCTWNEPTARGDARALTQAVLEFLALVIPADSSHRVVELRTEDRGDGIAFICCVNDAIPLVSPILEARIEWLLVRNWLTAAGAELERVDTINDQACLIILLAKR